ncbi:MAG: SNF2-related protein [Bryobacterales bacterium]|nr:SNF2-related protein [Bryobacterales bacterium]
MESDFEFEPSPSGLVVRMAGSSSIPVSDWTVHAARPPAAGGLVRLRDEGLAEESDDGRSLKVSWSGVAGLASDELRFIGLPDAAPFALEVLSSGAIHNADFSLRYGFIESGRRVLGVRRQGTWLQVGAKSFILLDPLYTIAEAMDEFNRAEGADLEARMLEWGQIAEMLPSEAVVDNHLRSLNIVVASAFELDPFVNEAGEPDFDPVIGRHETRVSEAEVEEQVFERSLPDARQEQFARRFRGLSRVKHRYAAGGNVFVVLTREVENALNVVRRAQKGTAEERRDFLRNVSGHLRGAFDEQGEDEFEIDQVFSDDGLSERVLGVGIWVEKAVPWIELATEPWLPPKELGLRVGDRFVPLTADELAGVLEDVRAARKRGDLTMEVADGVEIPADSTTVSAVERLIRETEPTQAPQPDPDVDGSAGGVPESESDAPEPDRSNQVLLVIDNLEDLQFQQDREARVRGTLSAAPSLRSTLFPHQQKGLQWLQRHWTGGSSGALLADDMGLGKTLEALAFLSCLRNQAAVDGADRQPFLVVAPTGLLRNWQDEHRKHLCQSGLGQPLEAHGVGLQELRTDVRATGNEVRADPPLPKLDVEKLQRAGWVLTTYEALRDYQHSFGRVRWCAAIFDEAQKIKNPNARVTDAALAMNIGFSILMTGTPVENRPADIWSILDRTEPGMFGTMKDFSVRYEAPGEKGASALEDLHRKLTSESDAPALMLRRLKEHHLSNLPEKRIHRRVVDMPGPQAEEYEQAVLRHRQGEYILRTLQRLRRISLHPFAPGESGIDQYIQESARLSLTIKILDEIRSRGEKALVFVESLEMQAFLIGGLRRRFGLPNDVLVINGSVSGGTRKARVDKFQQRAGFDVMLLSPRAGGVGLTLTAANHVIHLSRWWNPAVEDQCTDRIFRIGQERTAHVYLPLARHPRFGEYSFDLKLDNLLQRKRDMNRRVLAPTAASAEDMSSLYRSTTKEARDAAEVSEPQENQINVDSLEPMQFQEWVLQELGEAGYVTRRTPRSGDRGADGSAVCVEDKRHAIIVQCKHMEPDRKCGRSAVRQVLRSIRHYEALDRAEPMVVTNASGFTSGASRLARRKSVRLVDRHNLLQLRE